MNVSTEVRALVEARGRAVLEILKKSASDYKQEDNAYAVFQALKAIGVKFPNDSKGELDSRVLQILYVAGNTSANRQKLESAGKHKEDKATAVRKELLG